MQEDLFHTKMQLLIRAWKDDESAHAQSKEVLELFDALLDLAKISHEFKRLIPYAVSLNKWGQLERNAAEKKIDPRPIHPDEKRWPVLIFFPYARYRFR